jgi:hypothetical protein
MPETPANLVSRTDLAKLAQDENLVYIAIPRAVAEQWRHWSRSIEIRLDNDARHPRLRKLTMRESDPMRIEKPRHDRTRDDRFRRRRPPRRQAHHAAPEAKS